MNEYGAEGSASRGRGQSPARRARYIRRVLRRASGMIVIAAVAALAAPAAAQPAAPRKLGVDLGLQVGFGAPQGRINESVPLVLNDNARAGVK